ncbi:MAG: hypothetical protein IKQ06_07110 [Bacilli bacterium]|nr:hypothetical protein [Bacilli bacterium]
MTKRKKVISTALLKVKCINKSINPETMPFEKYIDSSGIVIKIDFPDGKSLVEKNFKTYRTKMTKIYLEFYEEFDKNDIMNYLMNENSDYRATSLDGTILRLSQNDDFEISKMVNNRKKEKKIKEFEIIEEKKD